MYKYLLCILFGILIFILSNTINRFSIGGITCHARMDGEMNI